MEKSTKQSVTPGKKQKVRVSEIKLPPLNFGQKQSVFSGGSTPPPKSYIPKPVRITQHKGG